MILVTGCTGYIGFHVCEFLELKKIPYFGIDNFSKSHSKNIIDKKKFQKMDINSDKISILLKSKKIKTILHAAAYSFPLESENNKKKYSINNIKKTKKFIKLCQRFNVEKFIFLSSSNVYNFNLRQICSVKENNMIKPNNYYGKTKSVIEKYLKNKFKTCYILRLFNIAGYSNKRKFHEFKNNYRRIMPVITDAYKNKLKLKINLFKNKNKILFPARDFVHIQDLLNIILKITKRDNTGYKVMNVCNNKLIYLNLIIKNFEQKLNKKIRYTSKLNNKGNYSYTLGNNSKLKKNLKFSFRHNFNDIVKSCIKNYN